MKRTFYLVTILGFTKDNELIHGEISCRCDEPLSLFHLQYCKACWCDKMEEQLNAVVSPANCTIMSVIETEVYQGEPMTLECFHGTGQKQPNTKSAVAVKS